MGLSFLVSHKQDLQGIAIFLFYLLEATTTLFRNFGSPSFPSCQGIPKDFRIQWLNIDINNSIY